VAESDSFFSVGRCLLSAVAATDILNKAAKRIVVFKKFIPIGVIFVLIGGKISTKI
jgi:hypothetical protein